MQNKVQHIFFIIYRDTAYPMVQEQQSLSFLN